MTLDQIVQLEQRTREYFKTMKLQDSVVDKLFQIPSGAIRMLSDDKLSPLRTGASNLEEYITQKCKDPNRKAYLDCRTREIDDELIKHAKEYLRLYGNPSEAFIKIPVASGSPVEFDNTNTITDADTNAKKIWRDRSDSWSDASA